MTGAVSFPFQSFRSNLKQGCVITMLSLFISYMVIYRITLTFFVCLLISLLMEKILQKYTPCEEDGSAEGSWYLEA